MNTERVREDASGDSEDGEVTAFRSSTSHRRNVFLRGESALGLAVTLTLTPDLENLFSSDPLT